MSRPSSRALSRTGSPASSTASSVVQTGLEDCTLDELKERLGLYCANIRFHNPCPSQTADELAAVQAATERLADLRRKDPSTRLFIQAARWNRWVDPKGVEHRFAAGGKGEDGVLLRERQDLSLGLPKNEEDYRRLVETKRARQAAPVSVVVPSSPAPAPLLTYPDSSLTALTSTSQLPASSGQRGRSPSPSTSTSGTSTASARTAHKRRASLSPVAPMKSIEPECADVHVEAGPAAGDDARPPSAGSSGSSSTQSNLAFPVVKAKARGKQREGSAGPSGADQGVKRKSTKEPVAAAPSDRKGKARAAEAVDLATPPAPKPPPPAEVDLDEAPWDDDDSVEIAAGKGAAYRQKMRINPNGWDGIEDMSACAEFLPLSFPSDLATSTPVANKRRPPPILKPITSRAPAASAAVDDRAGQRPPGKGASPKGGSRKPSRATSRAPSRASADAAAAQRPLPMAPTEPGTPASDSPSSHSVPTPPPKRRQHLLSRSSMLGLTSSDSQVGGGPTSSLVKLSADGSLPFSIGFSQVDRRVDEVRDFLEAEGEGIDDSSWD